MIPSVAVKDILVGAGLGTFATDLFVGIEPDKPNKCLSVIDTGGFAPDASDVIYEYPTVQIRYRENVGGYASGYTKMQQVKDTIHKYVESSGNSDGSRIIGIWCLSDILFTGTDENERPMFTLNLRLQVTR